MKEPSCIDCGKPRGRDGRRKFCKPCSAKRSEVTVESRHCEDCGTNISHRHSNSRFCLGCSHDPKKRRARSNRPIPCPNDRSRAVTKYAVKVGFLPPPTEFPCVDCGHRAECYDHRDYNRPLDVDPVCLRCNSFRGAGIPLKSNKTAA